MALALRAEGQSVHTQTELIASEDSNQITAVLQLSNGDILQAGIQIRRLPAGVPVSIANAETGDPSIVHYRPEVGEVQRTEWDQSIAAIHDLVEAPDRGLFVFGSFQGHFAPSGEALELGQSQERSFTLRLDSTGQVLWTQTYGDTLFDFRSGAVSGTYVNDTLYEVGVFNSLYSYVLKRDPNTGTVWSQIVLPARTCADIEVNDQGHMAITGNTVNGVFPGLSLTLPSTANFYHYIVVLDAQYNGLWGKLSPYVSVDVEDRLHRSGDHLVHQFLEFTFSPTTSEVMYLQKYTWAGALLRTDSLPYSSASFLFNANHVLVRGNDYYTFVYDPYATVEVHHFNGQDWDYEGFFQGSFFLPLFLLPDGPEDLWIAGSVHMQYLYVNNDTIILNPNYPGGPYPTRRYWIHWDRSSGIGMPERESLDLKVWPNPTSDRVQVEGIEGAYTYRVLNLAGQTLLSGEGHGPLDLRLNHFASGRYVLLVSTTKGSGAYPLIKLKP